MLDIYSSSSVTPNLDIATVGDLFPFAVEELSCVASKGVKEVRLEVLLWQSVRTGPGFAIYSG